MAKNMVVAGDYEGWGVFETFGAISLGHFLQNVALNDQTVAGYELVTDERQKSVVSGVARGAIGGALLGPVGLVAGAVSAKSKGTYQVAVEFKDGKRSLLELDDKMYKALAKSCF